MSYNNTIGTVDISSAESILGAVELAKTGNIPARNQIQKFLNQRAEAEPNPQIAAYIKRGLYLEKNALVGLIQGTKKLKPVWLYDVKPCGSNREVRFFMENDQPTVGLRNITAGKVDRNMAIIGLSLMSAVDATNGGLGSKYSELAGSLTNLEWELKFGTVTVEEKGCGEMFNTENRTDVPQGFFKFEAVRMLTEKTRIDLRVNLPIVAPANTYLKAILICIEDYDTTAK